MKPKEGGNRIVNNHKPAVMVVASAGPGISLIIPAWNEAGRILDTLNRYITSFDGQSEPYELIVVCDGSKDQTAEIAQRFSEHHVEVISFPRRLGKGGAVLLGMTRAKYPKVGFVDADGPVQGSDLINLASRLSMYDCTIASRWTLGTRIVRPQPVSRVILGRAWNMLVRFVLLLPVKDTQCGAKFFRSELIPELTKKVTTSDWSFDAAVLYSLRVNGYSIQEVPVTWTNSDGSKLILASAIPMMLRSLLMIRVRDFQARSPALGRFLGWFLKGEPARPSIWT
jgi:dolichol-phosphate mannosyltransferase